MFAMMEAVGKNYKYKYLRLNSLGRVAEKQNVQLNPYFVTGFTDGGAFTFLLQKEKIIK